MTGGVTGDDVEVEDLMNYQDPSSTDESGLDMSGTISGAPMVGDFDNPTTIQTPLSGVQVPGLDYSQADIDEERLAGYTPSSGSVNELTDDPTMQETISNAFTSARQNIGDLATAGVDQIQEIGQSIASTIGGIYNGEAQTISIFGKEINVPATLGGIALNQIVGAPISLAFGALKAIGGMLPDGGPSLQTDKANSIGLLNENASGGYQDIYGINTQSALGDYDQYNIDRVEDLETALDKARGKYSTEKEYLDMTTYMRKELEDRQEYNTISGVGGDINPEGTGDASVAESVYANEEPIGDQGSTVNTQTGNITDSSGNYAGNIMDEFEPAPAPAPAPAPSYNYSGGGGRDSGGGGSSSGGGGGGESGYGGFCFDPSTPIQMTDGSTKKIKDIQLGDDTKGGEVTGVFQFKATDEIHDYKGVTVAGSHYVKEDGKFIMVQDSPISIKIDKIPVVYSLDTTGRRIFIKDIEFADYNGDGIAKGFLHNAGVDTKGFDKEVLRQVEQRLI